MHDLSYHSNMYTFFCIHLRSKILATMLNITTVPYASFQIVPVAHLPPRLQEVPEAWMQRQGRVLMLPRDRLYHRTMSFT